MSSKNREKLGFYLTVVALLGVFWVLEDSRLIDKAGIARNKEALTVGQGRLSTAPFPGDVGTRYQYVSDMSRSSEARAKLWRS
ncbi:hypothetical protein BBP40_011269 [Aspergillus hancockii]|nr:hypothetical protein BBP40_011269 [Aspergillus hancockii]